MSVVPTTNVSGDAQESAMGSEGWIRAKDLASRWGHCSVSQVHRICQRHNIRRCLLGGTGAHGNSGKNAMVLYHASDILELERRSTV